MHQADRTGGAGACDRVGLGSLGDIVSDSACKHAVMPQAVNFSLMRARENLERSVFLRHLIDHEQSDVDTLAGVTPEASATNRNCKGPLESAILKHALKKTHTYLVQGPVWRGNEPIHGKLENGQWIPDALFISALFLHRKTVRAWTWLMENAKDVLPTPEDPIGANLHEISLDELEQLTGLYLWGNVRANKFKNRRNKLSGGTWWLEGQPEPKS